MKKRILQTDIPKAFETNSELEQRENDEKSPNFPLVWNFGSPHLQNKPEKSNGNSELSQNNNFQFSSNFQNVQSETNPFNNNFQFSSNPQNVKSETNPFNNDFQFSSNVPPVSLPSFSDLDSNPFAQNVGEQVKSETGPFETQKNNKPHSFSFNFQPQVSRVCPQNKLFQFGQTKTTVEYGGTTPTRSKFDFGTITTRSETTTNPFLKACENGDFDTVKEYMKHPKIDVNKEGQSVSIFSSVFHFDLI